MRMTRHFVLQTPHAVVFDKGFIALGTGFGGLIGVGLLD
jgi:hypothetical protein